MFLRAFECLPYDLFTAKLFANGFGDKALRFIYDYLRYQRQRILLEFQNVEWNYRILSGVAYKVLKKV